MPQQQIAFINFRQLGQDLRRAAAGFRSNPPRVPAGLTAIYDRIGPGAGRRIQIKQTIVIPVLTTFPATVAEAKALNGQVS